MRGALLPTCLLYAVCSGCAATVGADGPDPRAACTPSTRPTGATTDFRTAGTDVAGASVSAAVACGHDSPGAHYVTVTLEGGTRRLRLGAGAIRCADGAFRLYDPQQGPEDLACGGDGRAADGDAEVFADAFFRDVSRAWSSAGIDLRGIGTLGCAQQAPMIALGDFQQADRAVALVVDRARAWQIAGPIHVLVRGRIGECPE